MKNCSHTCHSSFTSSSPKRHPCCQEPHLLVLDRTDGNFKIEKVTLGPLMSWLFDSGSALRDTLRNWISTAHWISRFVGWLSHQPFSRKWIEPFVQQHQINMEDFEVPAAGFAHFDDFFSRRLRKGARAVRSEEHIAVMPADARYRRISSGLFDSFEAKNHNWSLNELLGPLVFPENGSLTPSCFSNPLLARLCPTDYHRFHSPIGAKVGRIVSMGEKLHSVHAWSLDLYPEVIVENKRVAVELITDEGRWIVVAIGASCVGSIELSIQTGDVIEAGQEIGCFHFGGSCLVIVNESPLWQEADDLTLLWTQHPDMEILAKMGEPMKIKKTTSF